MSQRPSLITGVLFLMLFFVGTACVCTQTAQTLYEDLQTEMATTPNGVSASATPVTYAYGSDMPPTSGSYIHIPQGINTLNLRNEPSDRSTKLGRMAEGDYFPLLAIQENWVRVDTSIGEGWVARQYVDVVQRDNSNDVIDNFDDNTASIMDRVNGFVNYLTKLAVLDDVVGDDTIGWLNNQSIVDNASSLSTSSDLLTIVGNNPLSRANLFTNIAFTYLDINRCQPKVSIFSKDCIKAGLSIGALGGGFVTLVNPLAGGAIIGIASSGKFIIDRTTDLLEYFK